MNCKGVLDCPFFLDQYDRHVLSSNFCLSCGLSTLLARVRCGCCERFFEESRHGGFTVEIICSKLCLGFVFGDCLFGFLRGCFVLGSGSPWLSSVLVRILILFLWFRTFVF